MRITKLVAVAILFGSSCIYLANAQQSAPDNTQSNLSDQKTPAPTTADQQKNNSSDVETTRAIRQALMHDKSLSTYAHNVKIITQNGEVTLKGPVKTSEERDEIQAKAEGVAGAGKVTNQISVKPQQ